MVLSLLISAKVEKAVAQLVAFCSAWKQMILPNPISSTTKTSFAINKQLPLALASKLCKRVGTPQLAIAKQLATSH